MLFFFGWGYADNQPNFMADRETPNIEGCGIDIGWAVDEERQPVSLDFVDFVRVYTGLNQKCGWLLETSTEILGAEDLHLEASIQAIRDVETGVKSPSALHLSPSTLYDLQGRKAVGQRPGVYINGVKKLFVK